MLNFEVAFLFILCKEKKTYNEQIAEPVIALVDVEKIA
jgi:hypothetical protein